eukprot:1336697-Amorphochlora_amoeboformis.AAC.2
MDLFSVSLLVYPIRVDRSRSQQYPSRGQQRSLQEGRPNQMYTTYVNMCETYVNTLTGSS